jgi:hypothetical protein
MRQIIAWLAPTPTFTRGTVGVGGGENAQLAAVKFYFVFFRDKIYQIVSSCHRIIKQQHNFTKGISFNKDRMSEYNPTIS